MERPQDSAFDNDERWTGLGRYITAALRQERRGLRRYIGPKRILLAMFLAAVIAVAWHLRRQGILDPAVFELLIQDHPFGALLIFVLIYSLAVLSALPTLPINLAAGFFWGPILGGLLSTGGATLGAIGAFAAARSIFGRPLARRFENKMLTEVQREFEAHGWWFVAFARINPAFPTGPLNYLLGLTSIDVFTYVWVTFVFLLPPGIAVAWIGHSVGTFVMEGEVAGFLKAILSISAAVTILTGLGYAARIWHRLRRKTSA
jgi:uncharacterized membrane protein YdjX (TVP38/TMEM64 family)